jgi:hypothetical protein
LSFIDKAFFLFLLKLPSPLLPNFPFLLLPFVFFVMLFTTTLMPFFTFLAFSFLLVLLSLLLVFSSFLPSLWMLALHHLSVFKLPGLLLPGVATAMGLLGTLPILTVLLSTV